MRSMKKRTTNMNIHHKNMKQISHDLQAWTESHMSNIGVFELSYGYYDLKNKRWMGMASAYPWYCSYLEHQYDMQIYKRLNPGLHYWDKSSDLYNRYKSQLDYHNIDKAYKCDLVIQNDQKFEMLTIACKQKLSGNEESLLEKYLRGFSYQAHKIMKNKKNILLDLKIPSDINLDLEDEKKLNLSEQYEKSKFGDIVLTSKEIKYIENTIFNLSHKEIAYQNSCSQTAVRKVICNIKRKLGCESMPTSYMLKKLKEIGVLNIISSSLKY